MEAPESTALDMDEFVLRCVGALDDGSMVAGGSTPTNESDHRGLGRGVTVAARLQR